MASTNLAMANERRDERAEVHFRTTASAHGAIWTAVVVNISPGGLMLRCDGGFAPGDVIQIRLPGSLSAPATVIWALGGRLGCEFVTMLPPALYFALLPRLS